MCYPLNIYLLISLYLDHYIGTSLKFIVVNLIRRTYVEGFNMAVLNYPFQVGNYSNISKYIVVTRVLISWIRFPIVFNTLRLLNYRSVQSGVFFFYTDESSKFICHAIPNWFVCAVTNDVFKLLVIFSDKRHCISMWMDWAGICCINGKIYIHVLHTIECVCNEHTYHITYDIHIQINFTK